MTSKPISARSRNRKSADAWRLGLLALTTLLMAGCKSPALQRIVHRRPPAHASGFAPANHVQALVIPNSIRRVAVLPLHAESWHPDEIAGLDEALRGALGHEERFEITTVSRSEMAARFGAESFASSGALPADLFPRLQADFGVDAVLLLDLTRFSPYQPLALGIRAKLVTVETGLALWSFDSVFDAARADVSEAARRFSTGQKRPGDPSGDSSGVLQSPSRFAKYVGATMFETLPPRQTR